MSEMNPFELEQAAVRLVSAPPLYSNESIDSPEAAIRVMAKELKSYDREVVAVINLQTNLEPINFTIASMGAIDNAIVHPREMMKNMFLSNAQSVIILHNHPSGNLTPSKEDIQMTDRLAQLCNLAGIGLLDHIIIGGGNDKTYYSMKEHEEIPANKNRFTQNIEAIKWPEAAAAESKTDYDNAKTTRENSSVRATLDETKPLYRHGADYAYDHGQRDEYIQSRRENVACKNAIEKAISENFDGMHLNPDAAKAVVKRFGAERVSYVLAATVQTKSWDGRFSRDNKIWANGIDTPEDKDYDGGDRKREFVVESHPAILDGFIKLARAEMHEESMPLKDYLVVKGVDAIEDDRQFIRAEFETVRDWCDAHDFQFSPEDLAEIKDRSLLGDVEDLKADREGDKPSVLEKLEEKKEEAAKTPAKEKSKVKDKNVTK